MTPERNVEKDIVKAVATISKPVWELSNELNDVKNQIKNKIAQSDEIEKLIVEQAKLGLTAKMTIFTKYGPKLVDDHSTRHKYWHDILIMKKWLSKTDINVDMRSLTINAQEEEILRKYERGE